MSLTRTMTRSAVLFYLFIYGSAFVPRVLAGVATDAGSMPDRVGYQGYLTTIDGTPINGDLGLTFRLCTDALISPCPQVWSETQTVTVNRGLFSTELGAVTPLDVPAGFSLELWLEVEVDGEGAPMTPRQRLVLAPYAAQSLNADTVDDLDAVALDQSAHLGDTANPHGVTAAQIGAASPVDITGHAAQAAAHHAKTTSFAELADQAGDAQIPDAVARDAEVMSTVLAADGSGSGLDADTLDGQSSELFAAAGALAALQTTVAALQAAVTDLQTRNAALEEKLAKVSVSPDGAQVYITGANLHLRSGSGTTGGAVNGLGNLIVGYNAARSSSANTATCSLGQYTNETDCTDNGGVWAVSHKSGSHNIVVGSGHNYSRFGGLVVGFSNTISANYASVSGGQNNTASGSVASVSGGNRNSASGSISSISGGGRNSASGSISSISGGRNNTGSGEYSSILGGGGLSADGNEAFADYSAIVGGRANTTGNLITNSVGQNSVVSGGTFNATTGDAALVGGGSSNAAVAPNAVVGGGLGNIASGENASVGGGLGNTASGGMASIGGGRFNTASGVASSILGGGGSGAADGNEAFADYSAIVGGRENLAGDPARVDHAIGERATVGGGQKNIASGENATVSGGDTNRASGTEASVAGGASNVASGNNATVSGGKSNTAEALESTVSGGEANTASGTQATVSGGAENQATANNATVGGGARRSATGQSDWVAGSLTEDF